MSHPNSDTLVMFIHMERTGGVTFHNTVTPYFKGSISRIRTDGSISGVDKIQDVLWLMMAKPKYPAFLSGHIGVGVHIFHANTEYLTILRDPIARAVSEYYYFQTDALTPDNPIRKSLYQKSLLDYAKMPEFSNRYVRRLTGTPHGTLNNNHLEQAYFTLKNFDWVGFTDSLEPFISKFLLTFNLIQPDDLVEIQRTEPSQRASDHRNNLSTQEYVALQNANALDLELYERMRHGE